MDAESMPPSRRRSASRTASGVVAVSVLVDGKPDAALRRDDGYLWIALPAGVHQVHIEGLLPDVTSGSGLSS